MTASITFVHSGHRDCVVLGRPFCSGVIGDPRVGGLGLNHFEVGAAAFSHSGAAGSAFVRGRIHCFWRNGLCARFVAALNSDGETNLARIVLIL